MSRWGGFRKGRKRVRHKKILNNAIVLPSYIDNFSYVDSEGIWNLKSTTQFSKIRRYVEKKSTSFNLGNSNSFTVDIPSDAKSGDLAILFSAGDNSNASQTTPPGWTLIGNGNSSEFPRVYSFYKIIEDGDAGSTVTINSAVSEDFSCGIIIFESNLEIVNVDSYGYSNNKGPSSYSSSINASTASGFIIAISNLVGRPPSQQPTLAMSTYTEIIDSGNMTIGYAVYNDKNGQDILISTNDTGRQSLTGFYLVVS